MDREQTFWSIAEKHLQSRLSRPGVEFINFGVGGFGAAHEILMWRQKVVHYRPDIVLLAFFSGNDIADNSRTLKGQPNSPYFSYVDGILTLDDSAPKRHWENYVRKWWAEPHIELVNKFPLLQLAHRLRDSFKERMEIEADRKAWEAAIDLSEGLDCSLYSVPTDPVWKDAWQVTEGLLLEMRKQVLAEGSDFWVAIISSPIRVDPRIQVQEEFIRRCGIHDASYVDNRIKKLCEYNNIPVLSLAPALRDHAIENGIFLHGFEKNLGRGHWNQDGHKLAGRLIGEWMSKRLVQQ